MSSLPKNADLGTGLKPELENVQLEEAVHERTEVNKKEDDVGGEKAQQNDELLNKKRMSEELVSDDEPSVDNNEQSLSKRQKKKLLKQQKYEEIKKLRKVMRKEKQRLKREQRELEGEKVTNPTNDQPVIKYKTMASPDALPLKITIDLSFDNLMSDKDINKLTKQLQRCYSLNRRADHPLQLYFTSFGDKCKKRLDDLQGHYVNWDVHIKAEHLTDVFPKDEIVYLSSDSPNVLREIDMSKTYVIGGLVDHNHHKGLCYDMAECKGIGHAQLPINEFLKLTTRTVLTVNQVFEILMHYMESKDWSEAFFKVLPQRKITPKVRKRGRNKAKDGARRNDDDDNDDITKDQIDDST
ncbi:hypothetical protein QZH41_005301 [Actinostola sp. cb2023]|nr:hypothetical protein QZH41_005301 [Actinostola sp. cb2023]